MDTRRKEVKDPYEAEKFWTFSPSKVSMSVKADGAGGQRGIAEITGRFGYVIIYQGRPASAGGDGNPTIEFLSLSDEDTVLHVPSELLGKSPKDMSLADVFDRLVNVFGLPFKKIPPPPITAPLHRLDPEKRAKWLERLAENS